MNIRALPPDEWHRLQKIADEYQRPLPHPACAQIVVAEDENGEIQGLSMVQLVPHIEPIWVAEKYRGQKLWKTLIHSALDLCATGTHLFAFSPRPGIDKIAESFGFQSRPWKVYEGIVE